MKLTGSKQKYSLRIIIALFLGLAIVGIGSWYLISRRDSLEETRIKSGYYVPGEIEVTFKYGITFQQAKDLITSFNLKIQQPDSLYEDGFTPFDFRAVPTDQFDQITNNLKVFPEVTSFVDASDDPGRRAGPGYTWVKFTMKQDVSMSRIVEILESSGLGLGATPDHPVLGSRSMFLSVPDGQEQDYINKFKESSIIESARRIGRAMPT